MSEIRLYSYWRSTAAYRVRIALNLKQLKYEVVPVDLLHGEHRGEYRKRNPQGLVPALEHDGRLLIQSLAIVDYIDRVFPGPSLLPVDAPGRARVNALAQIVAADMHPLNNLRVLKYLTGELGLSEQNKQCWYAHWVAEGFRAIEELLDDGQTGDFCHGGNPGLADACLVPQVYNARRFDCDVGPYPRIRRIEENCLALAPFADAVPERQPDAPA